MFSEQKQSLLTLKYREVACFNFYYKKKINDKNNTCPNSVDFILHFTQYNNKRSIIVSSVVKLL